MSLQNVFVKLSQFNTKCWLLFNPIRFFNNNNKKKEQEKKETKSLKSLIHVPLKEKVHLLFIAKYHLTQYTEKPSAGDQYGVASKCISFLFYLGLKKECVTWTRRDAGERKKRQLLIPPNKVRKLIDIEQDLTDFYFVPKMLRYFIFYNLMEEIDLIKK